ncbi:helix-turn-helix domain-containing protein [Streptomyces scopuliridis]|uniref:helix-turn-helix domain-containing protein n=1 Tax=Streptomyces scopuliridis TaxID=452529 RepID=UPI0036B988CE
MSGAGAKLGVGTHFRLDGETVEVVEFASMATGMEVILKDGRDRLARMSLRELLTSDRAELIHDGSGPSSADDEDVAAVVLNRLTKEEKKEILERAEHVREMLTGYRSGSEDLPRPGEPRPQYAPGLPLHARYEAKAAELGVSARSTRRWAQAFREHGEAGLVPRAARADGGLSNADPRWVEAAEEVLSEYEEESRPSVKVALEEVEARVKAKFKLVKVPVPPQTTAYRWMQELERRHPTFRLSTQRNRDIADRPRGVYGEAHAAGRVRADGHHAVGRVRARPGDAAVDAGGADRRHGLVHLMHHRSAGDSGVDEGHRRGGRPLSGIPSPAGAGELAERSGLARARHSARGAGGAKAVHGPVTGVWGPKVVPETLIVDHGKIYLSAHLTSVCRRMGISVQPARLRTGRDKGPVERFFRTPAGRPAAAAAGLQGTQHPLAWLESGEGRLLLPPRT